MEKPFIVRADYSLYIIIFLFVYILNFIVHISFVASSPFEWFMITIFYFIIATFITLVLKPEIRLTDDWIIYRVCFIEEKIDRHLIREIKTEKNFMFWWMRLLWWRRLMSLAWLPYRQQTEDTIFLDASGEEISRLDLSSPFYNQNDMKELIKRLQDKINKTIA